ncbi:MAG: hypothetical protein V3T05_10285 [Myxococcota bacterium]
MSEPNEPASPDEAIEKFLNDAHHGAVTGSLTGGLAHHFNNLLGGVLGLATLAPSLGKEELTNLCARVRDLVEEASQLTRVLLSVTRSAEGATSGKLCELRIRSEELVKVAELCTGAATTIELSLPDTEVWAEIPSVAYSEILLNLVMSVVSAARLGGEKTVIRVWVEAHDDACLVTVEDPREAAVCDVVATMTQAAHAGAAVLAPATGLVAARSVAGRYGGSVAVEQTCGGARYTVRLPTATTG